MSVMSGWLIVLLKSVMSLLIFCLLVLLVTERGVLKSMTVIVDLYISPCSSVFAICNLELC